MLAFLRRFSTKSTSESIYKRDELSNVTPRILEHVGCNLYKKPFHPLSLVRENIIYFFYDRFKNARGNPLFSIYESLDPVVSVQQNFDSLLVPPNHVSRSKTDCYYINKNFMLRGHMTAHQVDLIKSGLDNFLMIGDVYRRDEIDRLHYPVFHQIDGVRLLTNFDLDPNWKCEDMPLLLYTSEKPPKYNENSISIVENEMKTTLMALAKHLFSRIENLQMRWMTTNFPFTEPSWELEAKIDEKWIELLGCGVIRKQILDNCGIIDRIGWAFGLGLERIAMLLYSIPDIRIFWSADTGFLNQFKDKNYASSVTYKPVSQYPQCINDISFWLPDDQNQYSDSDFYEIVRTIGGHFVEQVELIDEFRHPNTGKCSKCFRITYRHMEKTLTKEEVNEIHSGIEKCIVNCFNVKIR